MSDRTITTANDVYTFVAQLKAQAEKRRNTDLVRELDEALHLGGSGLEILGAIPKTIIENHTKIESLLSSNGYQKQSRSLPL